MKLEKCALWSEMKLFRDYPDGKYGCIGFIPGRFAAENVHLFGNTIRLTPDGRQEAELVLSFLESEDGHFLLKSKAAMEAFCREKPQCHIPYAYGRECWGFRVLSEHYAWYISCTPWHENRAFTLFGYRKGELFTALAEEKGLVPLCYGVTPYSGVRMLIRYGERSFEEFPQYGSRREENMRFSDAKNAEWKITRQQQGAMIGGAIYGWDTPASEVDHYDEDGCFCPEQTKKKKHTWFRQ